MGTSTEAVAKKQFYKKWWFWVIVVVVLAALGKGSGGGGGATPSGSAASAVSVIFPSAEARLIEIVSAAQTESRRAENDMQRGGIKAKRDKALCEAITTLAANDWIGTVEKVDSNSDGKGVLEIAIAEDITVKTWNNALSDMSSETLIEPGSPVFEAASAMKRGQRVAFSGTFFRGSDGDCLDEGSLSLRGKLQEPEFIFRFSAISANLPTQQPPAARQSTTPQQQAPTPSPAQAPAPSSAQAAEPQAAVGQADLCEGISMAEAPELLECLDKKFAIADGQLNVAYKQLMATRDEATKAALKKEQIAWIKDKEKTCAEAGKEFEDLPRGAILISNCKVQMTEERVAYLKGYK